MDFVSSSVGLHPAVGNLIELTVALRPDLLGHLVERLDHPVVQARAARCAVEAARLSNHRVTLDWIRAASCPAQVALAIVYSLETVNALDYDLRFSGREDVGGHTWATELRPPPANGSRRGGRQPPGRIGRSPVAAETRSLRPVDR